LLLNAGVGILDGLRWRAAPPVAPSTKPLSSPMGNKKTAAELRAENAYLRRVNHVSAWASVANSAIRWGALVVMALLARQAIQALAGKETDASLLLGLEAFGKVEVTWTVTIAVGLAGITYGLKERGLRKETVKRLGARPKELEKRLDPGRTSSRITEKGDTHERDLHG